MTNYFSNRSSASLRRGTIATMHLGGAGQYGNQPACGKTLKDSYRVTGKVAELQYDLCPECRKIQKGA
jgi:hypothetical protein